MSTTQDKAAFSARLKLSLRKSGYPVRDAAELARLFNLQHSFGISVQLAHKWLNGRAIPSDDKMVVLAKWLQVSKHWLYEGLSLGEPEHNTENLSLPAEIRSLLETVREIEMQSESERQVTQQILGLLTKLLAVIAQSSHKSPVI